MEDPHLLAAKGPGRGQVARRKVIVGANGISCAVPSAEICGLGEEAPGHVSDSDHCRGVHMRIRLPNPGKVAQLRMRSADEVRVKTVWHSLRHVRLFERLRDFASGRSLSV